MSKVKKDIGFSGSVAVLTIGTFVAHFIVIISAPLIARLFDPDVFGLAGAFVGLTMMTGQASTLHYGGAVLLPNYHGKAATTMLAAEMAVLLIATVGLVVSLTVGSRLLGLVGLGELGPSAWLFPMGILAFGLAGPLYIWSMRQKRFVSFAGSQILMTATRSTLCLAGGLLGLVAARHLVAFQIIGAAVAPFVLIVLVVRHDLPMMLRAARLKRIWAMMRRYRRFPYFSLPTQLVRSACIQVPVLLMINFFGEESGGYYSYAIMLLSIPILSLGQSVAQAFSPHIAHAHAHGLEEAPLIRDVLSAMLRLGVLPFGILMLLGPEVFAVYLGGQWVDAGHYAAILAPMLFLEFVGHPAISLYAIYEKQLAGLITTSGILIAYVVGFLVGRLLFGVPGTLILVSVLASMVLLFRTTWISRYGGVSPMRVFRMLGNAIFWASPFIGVVAAAKYLLHVRLVFLFGIAALSAISYFAMVYKTDGNLRREVLRMIPLRVRNKLWIRPDEAE